MIQFLAAPQNILFSLALGLMLLIGLLEVISLLLGAGLAEALDNLLPDLDLDVDADLDFDLDADVDADLDADATVGAGGGESVTGFLRALTWLGLGKVPLLILVVIFLCTFGVSGLIVQFAVQKATLGRFLLPWWLSWAPALAVAMPFVRWTARGLGRIMPKEETEAVSSRSLVGRVAVVVTGTARLGSPAQAKARDQYGQTHYIMIEPDDENEEFPTGTTVVLVKQIGAVYQAIRNTSDALVD